MPFVHISLARGKPREYLQAVFDGVHEALVDGLGMLLPQDRFQLIHEFDRENMNFPENSRGGAAEPILSGRVGAGW